MASSEKPNSRARRHSGTVVISQSKKKRSKKYRDKDTDTESISSSTNSSAGTVAPEPKKCPLRLINAALFKLGDGGDNKKQQGCPLRRVQLWHVIPLCLLAIVNLLLVIIALLGLAGYRITMGVQSAVVNLAKPESPYDESVIGADGGTLVVSTA